MFNRAKLKGRIIEKYGSQMAFASRVKRTQAFISKVLNCQSILTECDIKEWAEALEIPTDEIGTYFFAL